MMTAKELAEMLMKTPDATVFIFDAGGFPTEVKGDFIRYNSNWLYIQAPYDY